jgi:hypothetical protein
MILTLLILTFLIFSLNFWLPTYFTKYWVYGFNFKQLWQGFHWKRSNNNLYILYQGRLDPKVKAIYWLAGKEWQYEKFAQLMCERKTFLPFNQNVLYGTDVCAMSFRGHNVWPSKEIAEFCGDPNGWWPDKEIKI